MATSPLTVSAWLLAALASAAASSQWLGRSDSSRAAVASVPPSLAAGCALHADDSPDAVQSGMAHVECWQFTSVPLQHAGWEVFARGMRP